jgi:hypothetical protein
VAHTLKREAAKLDRTALARSGHTGSAGSCDGAASDPDEGVDDETNMARERAPGESGAGTARRA